MDRKFKAGDKARVMRQSSPDFGRIKKIEFVDDEFSDYCYKIGDDWYCADDLDEIGTDDHFADADKMMRLQIAAQMAHGMLLVKEADIRYRRPDGMIQIINKDPKSVAEVAFMFADALIAESQKGGDK